MWGGSNTSDLDSATAGLTCARPERKEVGRMVIRFFGGATPPTWQDQGMIAEVHAYWEALRRDSRLPRRMDIDPRGIARALENAFLIERIGTGIARFRIAGMIFHELVGMDVRGMPLSALFLGEARLPLQVDLERLFHSPAKVSLALRSEGGFSRPEIEARLMMLPVSGLGGKCDLALGCIEISGEAGRAPRRFRISGRLVERVDISQEHQPGHDVTQPENQPVPMAQARMQIPSVRTKPHLRLVYSAD